MPAAAAPAAESAAGSPRVEGFFDEATNTISYLVSDPDGGEAAIIDSVLDFDAAAGALATRSADAILAEASRAGLRVVHVLETHAHADHLSAAAYLRERTGAPVAIGARIREVQRLFGPLFGDGDVARDGGGFDRLLAEGDRLELGRLSIEVIETPGHTPADIAYRIGDAVFVGDTLFMPDYGTARADFPGGCARDLYRSIQRLLALPDETRLFMCHDYKAPGRDDIRWETTVAEEKGNVHLAACAGEEAFVAMREARDSTLAVPKLLLPAIQLNIRAGRLPPADANGHRYLRIPLVLQGGLGVD